MGSESCCYVTLIFLFIFPNIVMQGYGCFQKNMLHTNECGNMGLSSKCCFQNCDRTKMGFIGPRKISDTAAVLQITAFVTFLLFACAMLYQICYADENNTGSNCIVLLLILMYFISGVFCVVGCGLIAWTDNRPDDSSLGTGFYCFLVSGIYVLVQMILLICCCCYALCCHESSDVAPYTQYSSRAAATPTTPLRVHMVEHHEAIYEPNGRIIVRFTRMLGLTRSQ